MMDAMEQELQGLTVLVVEDEYYLADDICRAFRRLGASIMGPAPTVAEATERLKLHETPNFAVLDISLNGESVYPLADELNRRGVPFVFTTGYDPTAMPDDYRKMPRWEKPFDPAAFALSVAALLRK
ncbi:response regulator [Jiella avicenniae]|uniref:Response regulator n=1 Tax=Jiella avicenniae TaxID=2907202 RepID=A0A9X1P4E4_9HYPH|nr:response regulator [Jiella avicenniae]MCE7029654.1 response regulator [Jiella avicenniae]